MNKVIISEQDFDVGEQYQRLCEDAPRAGAVVFFVGLVRDFYGQGEDQDHEKSDNTNRVDHLYLEHYPQMTEKLCHQIIEQAQQRFSFDQARLIHRVGKVYAQQQIVMVAVASRHRDTAFQAAQFIMDYLKTRATFWKKEVGDKGEQWLGVKSKDAAASARWNNEG